MGPPLEILPDLSRRCPVADPDDHHLFVSLGCATENLVQAARAHGLRGEATFDAAAETALEHIVQGNQAQLDDPAFVAGLKAWIRFNGADAVRTGDGLCAA